ncbi:MAG TPA: FliM/FliN family flagellar motor switch protein [Aggregicoccus sp.]|nr:FliM/FliN family flagellar motor switch protein [Aggregicoccus sp.]
MVTQPGRHTTTLLHPRLQRLGLRRLTRAHRALAERPELGRVAGRALQAAGAALSQELQCAVSVSPRLLEAAADPALGLTPAAAFLILELSALGGVAVLELDAGVLLAAVDRVAGASSRPGVVSRLTRLEEATSAYLALCALASFRSVQVLEQAFAPRLSQLTMSREEAAARLDPRQPLVAVGLRVSVGPAEGWGRLLLPSAALQAAAQRFALELPAELAPEVASAAIPARCFLTRTQLPAQVFEALSEGDVVLFEELGLAGGVPTGPARLVTRAFTLLGSFQPEGFTLTRALPGASTQEYPMQPSPHLDTEGLPPLPVELEIELTRFTLSVAQLATLRPGVLLPLRISASEPVLLRVGARAVARAELVDIEGEVGARILELLP